MQKDANMPIWLAITLAVASLVVGLAGPVNTWIIFRSSNKPEVAPSANRPKNVSRSMLRQIGKFLFSVYTISTISIIYNLWHAVSLVRGQNDVTVILSLDYYYSWSHRFSVSGNIASIEH